MLNDMLKIREWVAKLGLEPGTYQSKTSSVGLQPPPPTHLHTQVAEDPSVTSTP